MLLSGWARAAGLRVAIVRSPEATPRVRKATARLGAVLLAAGFDTIEVEAPREIDARGAIEQAGEGAGAFATLSLWPVARSSAIDVWIADSMTHKTSVRRIAGEVQKKPALPRLIALHAVELLRASLLEVESPSAKGDEPSPEPTRRRAPRSRRQPTSARGHYQYESHASR
jgi:hypothetical protein